MDRIQNPASLITGAARGIDAAIAQAFAAQGAQVIVSDIDEAAAIAVLLASHESAHITGPEFPIDGGLLAGSAAALGVAGDA